MGDENWLLKYLCTVLKLNIVGAHLLNVSWIGGVADGDGKFKDQREIWVFAGRAAQTEAVSVAGAWHGLQLVKAPVLGVVGMGLGTQQKHIAAVLLLI